MELLFYYFQVGTKKIIFKELQGKKMCDAKVKIERTKK